ncbi:WhiB family transcriptional regulator [Streptomyces sp. NPDC006458]|uniref:WhiB family transcriptional regulator n=1 Tax=Streptomyces sp. NPDC006458 TaxID=3154302 RepID=UPI0033BE392C
MSVAGPCPPHPLSAPQPTRFFTPAEPAGWRSAAACAGLPPDVVFSKKVEEAAPALRACADCTVRRQCEDAVIPADNWFDGVCGGRLWRSGRAVAAPGGRVV